MQFLIWLIALTLSLGSVVFYGLLLSSIAHSNPTAGYLCLVGIAVCLKGVYEFLQHMAARLYTLGAPNQQQA